MRALLLAAGLGTRLRPLTDTIPKCLVPIGCKPLLEYWLDNLLGNGIERVLVNTHYLSKQVEDFVNDSKWRSKIDLVHEQSLLGTGGTLLHNREYFTDSPTLLAHADNLTVFSPKEFIKAHQNRYFGVEITMMTFETDCPQSCGIVELDENEVVQGFFEKVKNPPGNLANAAVYIFEPSVFSYLKSLDKSVIDISTEVLPHYVGKIGTFKNSKYHRDIGTVESLKMARIHMKQKRVL